MQALHTNRTAFGRIPHQPLPHATTHVSLEDHFLLFLYDLHEHCMRSQILVKVPKIKCHKNPFPNCYMLETHT
jgi:hypothetical protein